MSIRTIERILKRTKTDLARKYLVKSIGLFGSYVRGDQKKNSDLDVLVEFRRPIGLIKFMSLGNHLTDLIGIKVDLVSKEALKPHIGKHILREAIYL